MCHANANASGSQGRAASAAMSSDAREHDLATISSLRTGCGHSPPDGGTLPQTSRVPSSATGRMRGRDRRQPAGRALRWRGGGSVGPRHSHVVLAVDEEDLPGR